jgi:ribose transport system ATP-binding protein
MDPPALQMKGIGKRFPGVVALDAVDLDVHAGEVVALAGENGAGKSTLMKILGGLYQPDNGSILIDGREVQIRSVSDAARLGIGFVHQELNVLDNLTVADNVLLGREPRFAGYLIDRKKLNGEAAIHIARVGLDVAPETPLSKLSIAQQQLVEIAKALSQNGRILILDEPTSSLTLTETERLLGIIKELRSEGVSIVYISHRLGEIGEIADRVVVSRDGKNAGILQKDLISHDAIVSLMVGRDIQKRAAADSVSENAVAVEIRDLRTMRYPERPVSFDVSQGEILGVAGLVGSGRSEAAQAIFGVDRALGGTVTVRGNSVRVGNVRASINHGIFLVPEDRRNSGLIVESPIRFNITLPSLDRLSSGGLVKSKAEKEKASEMSERLKVKTPNTETIARNLSGGNQQKVVLAKWLALEPKLMFFDEPTRGIDVGAKSEIYQLMRDLAATGVSILMISSDMEEILNESDRIAVMHEGRITGTLAAVEATEESVMKLAVGGNN